MSETTKVKRGPGRDYREFLRHLKRGGWSTAQIVGDEERPAELAALLAEVGLEKAEGWIMKALDKGNLAAVEAENCPDPSVARSAEVSGSTAPTEAEQRPDPTQSATSVSTLGNGSEAEQRPDPTGNAKSQRPSSGSSELEDQPEEVERNQLYRRYVPKPGDQMPIGSLPEGAYFDRGGQRGRFDGMSGLDAKVLLYKGKRLGNVEVGERCWWSSATAVVMIDAETARGPYNTSEDEGHTATTEEGREVMNFSEAKARELLVACGCPGKAKKLSVTRLNKFFNEPAKLLAMPKQQPEDAKLKTLLKEVYAALDADTPIKVGEGNGKARKAGKKKAGGSNLKKPSKGRAKVMGKYSAGPFARWLGKGGGLNINFEAARKVMDGEGCPHLSDVSLKWELKETRENCPPAAVSKDDAAEIKRKYGLVKAKV